MTAPTFRVYLGYGSTWKTADGSISWTEETGYVLQESGVNIRRGRSSELDEDRAGTLSLTLNNSSRRFDPVYAAGDLFGDLKPGVPIKVEAVANSTTFPVFRGFVDGWPQDYLLGNELAVVNLTATDGFSMLATAGIASSPFEDYISRNLTPVDWWPLTDSEDAAVLTNRGSVSLDVAQVVELELGQPSLDGGGTSAGFTAGATGATFFSPTGNHNDSVLYAVFLVRTTATGGVIYHNTSGSGATGTAIRFGTSATGGYLDGGHDGGLVYAADSGGAINDGATHLVVLSSDVAGSSSLYIDGVAVSHSNDAAGFEGPTITTAQIGGFTGQLQHLMLFDSFAGLAAAAPAMWSAVEGWTGDLTGARIGRLLDLAGWPASLRAVATGLSTLGPTKTPGNALALLKRVEAVEQGRLFMSRDGKVTFRDRYYHQTVTAGNTSQATFSDDGSDNAYSTIGFDYDTRVVYNRVRASRSGGSDIEVTDDTSIDTYGEQVDSKLSGIDFTTDSQARSAAEYRLGRYKDPQYRARPVTCHLHGLTAAQQADILDLELGYRVNVERTPQGVGSAYDADQLIEGVTHRIGAGVWDISFELSPAPTVVHAVWGTATWGDDSATTEAIWGY